MAKTLQDWLDWQETLHPCEIDLGLQRVDQVIRQLLPDCYRSEPARFPFTIITIAGTNGKGSTVALLEAILCAAGYRVGSYTSPHLLRYNERIKINQTAVSDQLICNAFTRIDQARGAEVSLSYFEFGTLAAIDIMVQQACDIVVLEVGLGGRLDAVNVLDADISLVTTIDIDHQDWLGSDRNTIALEKAGIYRRNKPAIYGDNDCPETIKTLVKEQDLFFFQYSIDYHYSLEQDGLWRWGAYTHLPQPALKGVVQYKNAANVLMVLELLKKQLPVTEENIRQGLHNVRLAGRFQIISHDPFIVVDVAHNIQAARVLKQSLQQSSDFEHLHIIIGMLKDKDCSDVISVLESVADSWRVIELDSARARPADEIAAIIAAIVSQSAVKKDITTFNNFQQAFEDYSNKGLLSGGKDGLLVFGSFYTVTDALQTLGQAKAYE